jgi:hypothetical protein
MKQNAGTVTVDPIKGNNVTSVEKTNFQDKTLGNFVQSTATNWIEQNENQRHVATFQETHRDEWSVYLHDNSRNVYIVLDLWKKRIKYKDNTATEYRDLYKVVTVSAAPPQYVFKSLALYNQWYASGGEQRSGLPQKSMEALNYHIFSFRSNLMNVVDELERMKRDWIKIETSKSILANAYLSHFIPTMAAMTSQANNLVIMSAEGTVLVERADTIVKTRLVENQRKLTKVIADKARATEGMRVALINLKAAKAELSGDKGFLNGFLTGLSFTAYNPVKENIDKQTNAINSYNTNLTIANAAIQVAQRTQKELGEKQKTLLQLHTMRKVFVHFSNDLSEAENALSLGTKSADRAVAAKNKTLGHYYKERAGNQMYRVFGWIDSLQAVN